MYILYRWFNAIARTRYIIIREKIFCLGVVSCDSPNPVRVDGYGVYILFCTIKKCWRFGSAFSFSSFLGYSCVLFTCCMMCAAHREFLIQRVHYTTFFLWHVGDHLRSTHICPAAGYYIYWLCYRGGGVRGRKNDEINNTVILWRVLTFLCGAAARVWCIHYYNNIIIISMATIRSV